MNEVIKLLTEKNKTISTMESCTGGGIANAITNIEGSSEVFKFGAVTYSNEYKIKMGVSSNIIDKYTVYSTETSNEMSKNISNYTNSNYGIGVTGKLNRVDKFNLYGEDNNIWNEYLKKEEPQTKVNNTKPSSLSNIMEMAKNIDPDKLQDGITSIQKAISLFGDMITKNNTSSTSTYTPRPIYKKFDD